jgi:hypothetical protein
MVILSSIQIISLQKENESSISSLGVALGIGVTTPLSTYDTLSGIADTLIVKIESITAFDPADAHFTYTVSAGFNGLVNSLSIT